MPDVRNPTAEEFITAARKYKLGQLVTKISGSKWTGKVVGFYSTTLTPIGYAVESSTEEGSVQIYPEKALSPLVRWASIQGGEYFSCYKCTGCGKEITVDIEDIRTLEPCSTCTA